MFPPNLPGYCCVNCLLPPRKQARCFRSRLLQHRIKCHGQQQSFTECSCTDCSMSAPPRFILPGASGRGSTGTNFRAIMQSMGICQHYPVMGADCVHMSAYVYHNMYAVRMYNWFLAVPCTVVHIMSLMLCVSQHQIWGVNTSLVIQSSSSTLKDNLTLLSPS